MATITRQTKAPAGLISKRDGWTWTCSWKCMDGSYDQLSFQWRTNIDKAGVWNSVWTDPRDTSQTVTLNPRWFYPYTEKYMNYFCFRVAARKPQETKDDNLYTYTTSAYNKYDYVPTTPAMPTIVAELDDELNNVCKFTWEVESSDTDDKPLADCEWQSIFVKNCTQTDGSKLTWKSGVNGYSEGSGAKNAYKVFTEDTSVISPTLGTTVSYTRWIRVRARGAARGPVDKKGYSDHKGQSYWRYSKHVYSYPLYPMINKTDFRLRGTFTWIKVDWTADSNAMYPIDKVTAQWAMEKLELANLACPIDASWNDAAVIRDTSGKDSIALSIDSAPSIDEGLFFRILSTHDRNDRSSGGRLITDVNGVYCAGKLATPSGLSVSTNTSTYRATVSVTNNSDVPDSRIAIIYRAKKGKNTESIVVGIIPNGESQAIVQCPNWSGKDAVAFGVYAFQGSSKAKSRSDGVTAYTITPNIKSAEVWDGGSVPVKPNNVTVERSEDSSGEVILTWDWTWTQANTAEISWSKNPNAWESTDEPETYNLSNMYAAHWRVSGLETGVTWYFRIRLNNETDDGTAYGPYSDIVSIDLSSAPNIPVLNLSKAVITVDDTLTASWAYSSTDGTSQAYAEICEATLVEEIAEGTQVASYGAVIAHTQTAQSCAINTSSWLVGSEHNLCVRVTSGSGRLSGWSDPVTVTVAEPIECAITETSIKLVQNIFTYPYSSTPITINGIEWNDNGDGSITANGTATHDSVFSFGDVAFSSLSAGEYAVNQPDGASSSTYGVRIIGYTAQQGGSVVSKEYTPNFETEFEILSTDNYAFLQGSIIIRAGQTVQDFQYTPNVYNTADGVNVNTLTELPLTATVTGAGDGGITTLIIERAAEYHMIRPDESMLDGYEGETIAIVRQDGEGQITIGAGDLIGAFDDGALYRLIATAEDGLGQTDTKEIVFEVHWERQAEVPSATVEMINGVAKITPIAPDGAEEGDVCDIYRLTADLPELIVRNGEFGEDYADPYPAIGTRYGHRIVHRTVNGDYITADNTPAWIDTGADDGDVLDLNYGIIDFPGGSLPFRYNVKLSGTWAKDFEQTKYLGGSVVGDWNVGVNRTGTVNAALVFDDEETIRTLRQLAEYSGICHVRTPDGSSYSADVQVAESLGYDTAGKVIEVTLNITRVDPEELDGVKYSELVGTS